MKSQILIFLIPLFLMVNNGFCQDNIDVETESNPLSTFEQLIGGEWHQEGGYQIFSWGVGKKFVHAENYFVMNGEAQKVSEGVWFWHPGEQKIKGYFSAVNMPVEFFDYTTRFTDKGIESDLKAYSSTGELTQYIESLEFETQDQIKWTLYSVSSEAKTKVMDGVLKRQQ